MTHSLLAPSREIRDGVARSMQESGVDFKNPSAVAEWVRSNPKMLAKINNEAYAKAATEAFAGHVAGKATQNIPSPFNIPAEATVQRGIEYLLEPIIVRPD